MQIRMILKCYTLYAFQLGYTELSAITNYYLFRKIRDPMYYSLIIA